MSVKTVGKLEEIATRENANVVYYITKGSESIDPCWVKLGDLSESDLSKNVFEIGQGTFVTDWIEFENSPRSYYMYVINPIWANV